MNSSDKEDLNLIGKFQKGDKDAFGDLYQKYREQVFLFFISKGMLPHEASDASQDIFVNLLKYLKDTRLKYPFKTFLNQIIRNKLADYYRVRHRKNNIFVPNPLESGLEDRNPGTGKIDNFPIDKEISFDDKFELAEVAHHCLKKIKNERWRTILLMWIQQYKREQISDILNIPIGSVCSCLSRATPIFFACLRKHYIEK